jgi:molecular chaperone GrpE
MTDNDTPQDPQQDPSAQQDAGPVDVNDENTGPSLFAEAADELGDEIDIVETLAGDVTLDNLHKQLNEAVERHLRVSAELENFRKRSRRELEDQLKFSSIGLMADILAVGDNLQRAIDAANQSADATGLLEGVKMVAMQLDSVLEKHNCKRIDAAGAEFDPNLHEAIAQLPMDNVEPGKVAQVTVEGYTLHGRVVRPAQVIVASAPVEAAPSSPEDPAENSQNAEGD